MKNLIAVKTIKEVLGYDWNKTGKESHKGFRGRIVDGDLVTDVSVSVPGGVKDGKFVSQTLNSDGTLVTVVQGEDDVISNNYLHGIEFDKFIGAEIPVTRIAKKRMRFGAGFTVKEVPVQKIESGYWYGKYRVVDVTEDIESGLVTYIQKPVSLAS